MDDHIVLPHDIETPSSLDNSMEGMMSDSKSQRKTNSSTFWFWCFVICLVAALVLPFSLTMPAWANVGPGDSFGINDAMLSIRRTLTHALVMLALNVLFVIMAGLSGAVWLDKQRSR